MKKKNNQKTLFLIDALGIIHRAYFALPAFTTKSGEPTGALYGLCLALIKMVENHDPDYIIACYDTPEPTVRHVAYSEYKATRDEAPEDLSLQIEKSKDVFKSFSIPMKECAGYEADDIIATLARKHASEEIKVVVVTGDRDLFQLISDNPPISIYFLKGGVKEAGLIDEKTAEEQISFSPKYMADYKGLAGDASDNIAGIRGIGTKTATTLIKNFGSLSDLYKILEKDEAEIKKCGITDRMVRLLKEGKKNAMGSKDLATVNDSVSIGTDLPKEIWKEARSYEKFEKLLEELEFQSLSKTLRAICNKNIPAGSARASAKASASAKKQTPDEESEIFKKSKIALWILDSSHTNPTEEDITNSTKTNSLEESYEVLKKKIKEEKLDYILDKIEIPLIPVLSQMEKTGIKIDIPYLNKLSKEYHEALSQIEKKIFLRAGSEFNLNSPKQLSKVLFDDMGLADKKSGKTKKSTRESELNKIKDKDEIIPLILEYRSLHKLLSVYIDVLPRLADNQSRVHTKFVQHGTTTGRMASKTPNVQNIPVKTERGQTIRKAFIAEDNFKIISFDYSQIELRLAAFLSGDKDLSELFSKNDIHQAMAVKIFKVSENKITKEMRNKTKAITFGILYGMGIKALKRAIEEKEEGEATKLFTEYKKTFSGFVGYKEKEIAKTEKRGYTETYFGRRRQIPEIFSRISYIRAQGERFIINSPIQGTQADVIKLAMIKISEYIDKNNLNKDVKMLLQVHDELVFEIKEEKIPQISKEIKKIMENTFKDEGGILLPVDFYVGKNWRDVE
ncbi:MAG: DNA polymerase [Candidatus Campbellbacteria bacterium]|nr:DNA polymerase [Candidatus Campbellbacteria bacterium]